jgi:ribosomal protein S18 acetylase RimI-like enzyme
MKTKLTKPHTQAQKDFIVENVVRFYKENPNEKRSNSFAEIRRSVRKLLEEDENHTYFIIQHNGEPTGLIQVMQTQKKVAEIILIYLLPEYRHKKLGSSALKQVIKKLENSGVTKIKTEVNTTNNASQSFFESMDFEKHSLIYVREK